jgi:hypothetical protein
MPQKLAKLAKATQMAKKEPVVKTARNVFQM